MSSTYFVDSVYVINTTGMTHLKGNISCFRVYIFTRCTFFTLHRSGPARNESHSLENATLDAARNRQTTDVAPNESTEHRVTSNDAASDSYTEGGYEVPLLSVLLEMEDIQEISVPADI